ncbi:MAG: glycerol-3-phosphate 1-O-acyltransferase PlsY [Vallitaleaceae bacterium]|nr:glycerol-3-phosphate 1-O-acyltransferase PlsY [Vallitaleaceae bacterium]
MFRVFCLLIGYLLGCFQTAFIIGRFKKHIDIRQYGSGNSGTTNAIRVLGWKLGALTFAGDIAKAVIAVLLAKFLFDDPLAGFYAGFGAIIGHNWPIFLKFKGGKGIASTIGVLLAVDPLIGLIMIVILAITILLTKYVSLGSVLMVIAIPILMLVLHPGAWEFFLLGLMLMISALYRHKDNIKRLFTGTENKLGHKKNLVA